jgi:hypothetical protein
MPGKLSGGLQRKKYRHLGRIEDGWEGTRCSICELMVHKHLCKPQIFCAADTSINWSRRLRSLRNALNNQVRDASKAEPFVVGRISHEHAVYFAERLQRRQSLKDESITCSEVWCQKNLRLAFRTGKRSSGLSDKSLQALIAHHINQVKHLDIFSGRCILALSPNNSVTQSTFCTTLTFRGWP